jgi:hypothetical protein
MYVGKYFTEKGDFDEVGFIEDVKKHVERFRKGELKEFKYDPQFKTKTS